MPKVDGLDKSIRIAMLKDELADDGSEPVELTETSTAASATTVPVPVVPPAASTADLPTLIQMLAGAISQSGAMNAQTLKDALSDQATMARHPIPETYLSGGYPGRSVFHLAGDAAPRTELKCPMFLGVYTEKGETIPAFEIPGGLCSERERLLLNALTPGVFPVERNDGQTRAWHVVQQTDGMGQPTRMIIAVPPIWLSKAEQAQMPSQIRFLQQLTQSSAA